MRCLFPFIFLLLLVAPVGAQPSPDYEEPAPVVTLPPGPDKIITITKGQEAPFDGQLFNIDTAIRWGFWLQQYKYRLEADSKRYQQLCRVETDFKDKSLVIEKERSKKVETDLSSRLLAAEKDRLAAEEELRNPPWYSSWTFGVVVGVVTTAAVFALAVWAVDAGTSK